MKRNEWELVMIAREKESEFWDCVPARYGSWAVQKDKILMGAKDSRGVCCGALAASVEEGLIRIDSIYVKPEYRRQGAGRALIGAMRDFSVKVGKTGLAVEYPYPKMRETELFLLRCGFRREEGLETGNRIYTVSASRISELEFLAMPSSLREGTLMSLQELPDQARLQWLRRFGEDLPTESDPRNFGASLLPEESMVYVRDGKVEAFAVCCVLEDDSVYLASLHSPNGAVKVLAALLRETLKRVSKRYGDKIFCFATANEAGRKIADHLCSGKEEYIDIQMMRIAVLRTKGAEEAMEYNPYAIENMMPRLNGIAAVLEDLEIESDVLWSETDAPAVLASVDGRNLRFSYTLAGPIEEEMFMLNVACTVSEEAKNPLNMMLLCQQFNLESFFATALYLPASGQTLMRCAVPEIGALSGAEALQFLITLFLDSISRFEEFLKKQESAERE